ncbi:hypothetical protein ACRAWF_24435 [Streptomyces sp. L7]
MKSVAPGRLNSAATMELIHAPVPDRHGRHGPSACSCTFGDLAQHLDTLPPRPPRRRPRPDAWAVSPSLNAGPICRQAVGDLVQAQGGTAAPGLPGTINISRYRRGADRPGHQAGISLVMATGDQCRSARRTSLGLASTSAVGHRPHPGQAPRPRSSLPRRPQRPPGRRRPR